MAAAEADARGGEAGARSPALPVPRHAPEARVARPSRRTAGRRRGGTPPADTLTPECAGKRETAVSAWCVPCLVSLDTLQEYCRKEKLTCKSIGITKRNLNNYEVEYLCDYKVLKVITSEEAERRGQLYDNKGITYLFDLDYESDEFTVDAARYGNVSHFVNHSCDPNLQVFNVFIDNLDTRLPRIALFSTRTINAGEELTFDYQMKGSGDVSSDSIDHSPAKKRIRTVCKCGAVTCRGYLN
uniref:SUV39H2 histone lysine methyltransferase n=1 Tax=Ictidomys tridecemlineatus TaxID=43179 RepID=A0A287DBX5_ICTTR